MISDYNLPTDIVKEWNQWGSLDLISHYFDHDVHDDFGKYFTAEGIVQQEDTNITDIK